MVLMTIKIIPKQLKIYFIDVGQGDSTLVITPQNKKILIDGGGSEFGDYDVGKDTLLPYLLDRGVKSIDYIIVSHFDTDHVQGILVVMQTLSVKNVIISKQIEDSENYRNFIEIVEQNKINVKIVESGNRINIEKNLYFDVLWPNSKQMISENPLNNNAIVCKLNYNNFSMLFTGDIEEEAEREILESYKNNLNYLKSTVLKVAHHGSKSSTIQEFLDAVSPRFALIGVGKNNMYGHPNEEVLNRLNSFRH